MSVVATGCLLVEGIDWDECGCYRVFVGRGYRLG